MPTRQSSFSDSLSMHDITSKPASNARAANAISWFDKLNRTNRADVRVSSTNDSMESSNIDDTLNKSEEFYHEEQLNKMNSNEATSMLTPSVTATREFATPSRVMESNSSIKDETTMTRLASMISPIQPTSRSSDNTYDEEEEDDDNESKEVSQEEEEDSYITSSSHDSAENAAATHSFRTSNKRPTHNRQSKSTRHSMKKKHNKPSQENRHRTHEDGNLELVVFADKRKKSKNSSTTRRSNSNVVEMSREPNGRAVIDNSDVTMHNSTNFSSALLQNISHREGASLLSNNNTTSTQLYLNNNNSSVNTNNKNNTEVNMLIYGEHNDRAVDMYDNAMRVRIARERWLSVEKARRDKVQELQERQECTFRPRLSPYARKMKRPHNLRPDKRSSAEVLYRQLRHALMQRAEAERELAECTFRPLTLRRAKLHVGVHPEKNNDNIDINNDGHGEAEFNDKHKASSTTREVGHGRKLTKEGKNYNSIFDELYTEAKTRQHFENVLRPQIVEELRRRMANRGVNGDVTIPMSEEKVQEVVNRLFSGATNTQQSKSHKPDTVKATVSSSSVVATTTTTTTTSSSFPTSTTDDNKKGNQRMHNEKPHQPELELMHETHNELQKKQEKSEYEQQMEQKLLRKTRQERKQNNINVQESEQERQWMANDILLEQELKVESEKERKRLEHEAAMAAEAHAREALRTEYVKSILTAKFEALVFVVAQNTRKPFRRHDCYPVVEIAKVALDVLAADEAEEVLIILEQCNMVMMNVHQFVKCVLDYVKAHTSHEDKSSNSTTLSSKNARVSENNVNGVKTQWLLLTRAPPLDPETRRRACSAQRFIKSLQEREFDHTQSQYHHHHFSRSSVPHIKRIKINPAELERIRAKRHAERVAWEQELTHRRAVERGEAIDEACTFHPAPRRQIPYACRPDIVIPVKETKSQQLRRALTQEREHEENEGDILIHAINTNLSKNIKFANSEMVKNAVEPAVRKVASHTDESNRYAKLQLNSVTPTRVCESTARELFGVNDEVNTNGITHTTYAKEPTSTSPLPAQPNAPRSTSKSEQLNVKTHNQESSKSNENITNMLCTQPVIVEHPIASTLRETQSESTEETHPHEQSTPRSSQTLTHDKGSKRTLFFPSVTSYAAQLANHNNVDKINHAATKSESRKSSSCYETNKPESNKKEFLEREEMYGEEQQWEKREQEQEQEEEEEWEEQPPSKPHSQPSKHTKSIHSAKANKRNLRDQKEALMHLYRSAVTEYASIGDKMALSKLGRELLLKQLLEFQQSRSTKR